MKGVVTRELNRRTSRPSVNSFSPGFHEVGDTVFIAFAVAGDVFEGNNIWYKLKSGEFVWSGAIGDVEIEPTDYQNPEDRRQYMLCYREVDRNHFPNIRSQKVDTTLRFATLDLPQSPDTIQVFDVTPVDIANTIIADIKKLNNSNRKNVVIYIHGYDFLKGLKVDLLSQFVLNYTSHPFNTIAKVLFFSWPANGQRSVADDRAVEHGLDFVKNDLFRKFFVTLSQLLGNHGLTLNLVVHSFAHQLLNGILNATRIDSIPIDPKKPRPNPPNINPQNLPLASPTFEKVILLASDVTHLAIKSLKGEEMVNNFERIGSPVPYDYSNLQHIAQEVHVFYDEYDYLLYASSKKFNGSNFSLKLPVPPVTPSEDYRNLGNYGDTLASLQSIFPNSSFHHVQTVLQNGNPGNRLFYSFVNLGTSDKFKTIIDNTRANNSYKKINDIRTFIHSDLFAAHHRYLFSSRQVVDEILRIL
jgi:hypothetical protein